MPTTRDEAICLRQLEWSETSQVVTLFARDTGIVRAVAKGARREKGAYSGGVEVLTRGEMVAILKSSGAMATLTAWDLLDPLPRLRRSLNAHYAGLFLADATQRGLSEVDPHPALYDALADALESLGQGALISEQVRPAGGIALPGDGKADGSSDARAHGASPSGGSPMPRKPLTSEQVSPTDAAVSLRYLWILLDEIGYRPELGPELGPAEPEPPPIVWFDPGAGRIQKSGAAGAWKVRAQTVQALRQAARGEQSGPAPTVGALRLLNAYLTHLLGRPIPAAEAFFGPGGPGSASA